jgi:hypothetical protein
MGMTTMAAPEARLLRKLAREGVMTVSHSVVLAGS